MRKFVDNINMQYKIQNRIQLYELLKTYSNLQMQKSFQTINIPRLPVLTTEETIKQIKDKSGKAIDGNNEVAAMVAMVGGIGVGVILIGLGCYYMYNKINSNIPTSRISKACNLV